MTSRRETISAVKQGRGATEYEMKNHGGSIAICTGSTCDDSNDHTLSYKYMNMEWPSHWHGMPME